ncbi:DinB family protein [Paenibacillus nanensis]|uniref:DinB family protein n=1 Tax=Paenibacillus nanensis TaxID=393251 RepID=A0A3A1UQG2_9BACL|nr:DinB family protein [Paenibacillus nanensis]RIX50026.1 DinB family protein [Paenibacillus nanensis]
MQLKNDMLEAFAEWKTFLREIEHWDWSEPLREGKWSVHDVVSHIYLWDKYFLEAAILPISDGTPLTLKHLDYDEFNAASVRIGREKQKEEVMQLSISYRDQIIDAIRKQDQSKFAKAYVDADGNPFTVEAYLKDFIWHDRHHRNQIEGIKNNVC